MEIMATTELCVSLFFHPQNSLLSKSFNYRLSLDPTKTFGMNTGVLSYELLRIILAFSLFREI